MLEENPKVSIGIPVYNGEDYLEEAINSILNQSYQNYEVIITDNDSTDNTSKICQKYLHNKKIKYYKNSTNLGATRNWNIAFSKSRGEYFTWHPHDDVLHPKYIENCVKILDNHQEVVLCHSRTGIIDENGKNIGNYDDRTSKFRVYSKKPHVRFGDLIKVGNPCWWILGVMRSDALARSKGFGDYVHADRNLLAELSLMGSFYDVPEYLFLRRKHRDAYTQKYMDDQEKSDEELMKWWSVKRKVNYGNFINLYEYFSTVRRADLPLTEKIRCVLTICKWLLENGKNVLPRDFKNILRARTYIR